MKQLILKVIQYVQSIQCDKIECMNTQELTMLVINNGIWSADYHYNRGVAMLYIVLHGGMSIRLTLEPEEALQCLGCENFRLIYDKKEVMKAVMIDDKCYEVTDFGAKTLAGLENDKGFRDLHLDQLVNSKMAVVSSMYNVELSFKSTGGEPKYELVK